MAHQSVEAAKITRHCGFEARGRRTSHTRRRLRLGQKRGHRDEAQGGALDSKWKCRQFVAIGDSDRRRLEQRFTALAARTSQDAQRLGSRIGHRRKLERQSRTALQVLDTHSLARPERRCSPSLEYARTFDARASRKIYSARSVQRNREIRVRAAGVCQTDAPVDTLTGRDCNVGISERLYRTFEPRVIAREEVGLSEFQTLGRGTARYAQQLRRSIQRRLRYAGANSDRAARPGIDHKWEGRIERYFPQV